MSVTFRVSGFGIDQPELNIANQNAGALLGMLGIETDGLCGSVHPTRLLFILARMEPAWLQRPAQTDGRLTDCGITKDQAERYFIALRGIAHIAANHQRKVIWS